MSMFCYQCEQTAGGKGCTMKGVCGKDERTAALQDLLAYLCRGIAWYLHQTGKADMECGRMILDGLFTTVTNVNFSEKQVAYEVRRAVLARDKAQQLSGVAAPADARHPAAVRVPEDIEAMIALAREFTLTKGKETLGDTVAGLQNLIVYGLKGAAAYAHHAYVLGTEDSKVYAKFNAILAFLAENPADVSALLGQALETGALNFSVMELLDAANTGKYGHPEPTEVRMTPIKGKCIVVSGHDLQDLDQLLQQTAGKGINVYTHGEMLPCLAYPGLKKYPHLVGNYGSAWQNQQKEFDAFPGAVLMTTNCIQKPLDNYFGRIFTTGLVSFPGVTHIGDRKDFSPVIEAALAAPGFREDFTPEKKITIGFARNTVMSVAGTVVDAVKSGALKHIFLIGGCDGAKPGRNYYTEFAQKVPQDCVILTLACGKFRFNTLDFGTLGGLPRLLDMGQCNDAYSAIKVAVALAEVFKCGVNDLPLSLILSWYEQKAVAILLTLLYLGVKNIRLGPTLPAFLTQDALNVLVEKFAIHPITSPDADLAAILKK